jgi:uncharacterized protein
LTLYIDASAIVPMFVIEAGSPAMDRLATSQTTAWRVSDFAAGEVVAAFSIIARTNRMTMARTEAALAMFENWRRTACEGAALEPVDVRLATTYVRRFDLKLRLPDAIHLATCQRLNLTLITFDIRLANAAAALGITASVPA